MTDKEVLQEPLTVFLWRFPILRPLLPASVYEERWKYVVRFRADFSEIEIGFPDDVFLLAR